MCFGCADAKQNYADIFEYFLVVEYLYIFVLAFCLKRGVMANENMVYFWVCFVFNTFCIRYTIFVSLHYKTVVLYLFFVS